MDQILVWHIFVSLLPLMACSNVTIPIGHLLPAKPEISNEPEVLRMCAADLKRRGILPANITLKYGILFG
jgi:hypothetical protein